MLFHATKENTELK
jgi:hypothetical protein